MRFGCWVPTVDDVAILARSGYDFCELSVEVLRPAEPDTRALPQLRQLDALPRHRRYSIGSFQQVSLCMEISRVSVLTRAA